MKIIKFGIIASLLTFTISAYCTPLFTINKNYFSGESRVLMPDICAITNGKYAWRMDVTYKHSKETSWRIQCLSKENWVYNYGSTYMLRFSIVKSNSNAIVKECTSTMNDHKGDLKSANVAIAMTNDVPQCDVIYK